VPLAADIPAAKRAGLPVDLARLARDGDGWLTPEDRYALKTHGVCTQAQPGVFMIRVRVPGGRLSPTQARGLADLAEAHGESWVHLTTRQNVELHHVDARAVPAVLAATEALGLTNRSACGHTHRNVMSCPDAGVGLDEPFDCGPDARAVSAAVVARAAELNVVLPGRLNFAFGGCPACAHHARLNDGGFVSVLVDGEPGYALWAGGSLGTMPVLAVPLADFVPRRHVVAAALALTDAFVEHGDLDHPKRGRLKFVLDRLGEDAFRAAWRSRYERYCQRSDLVAAETTDPVEIPGPARFDAILAARPDGGWSPGVRPQRQPGVAMVTVHVPLGDLLAGELRVLADLVDLAEPAGTVSRARPGDGDSSSAGDRHLHLTRNQNVQYRDVPVGRVAGLRTELAAIGLGPEGADGSADVRACTGSAVCSLAITASPDAAARIARGPALIRNGSLRVHVSGCPNSCAQHQAADLGLAGGKVRIGGRTRLGYTVMAGADLGAGQLARPLGRVADDDVDTAVDAVIGTWEALRHPGERLADTLARVGDDAFGAHVAAVARGFQAGPEPAAATGVVRVATLTGPETASARVPATAAAATG
jgi:sulfite reductase beta subunit-like hemoprotein